MGLLSFLGWKRSIGTPITEQDMLRIISSGVRGTADNVNVENSLGLPTFWAAVRFHSKSIASLPFGIIERTATGEKPSDHSTNELLSRQPSDLLNAFNYKEMMQLDLETRGNAFSRIHRFRATVTELEWISPDDVTIEYIPKKRIKRYKIKSKDAAGAFKEIILDHDEVIHLMTMSKNGIKGRSCIEVCKDTLGLMMDGRQYASNWYANGAQPSGAFVSPVTLSDTQVEQFKKIWKEQYQGVKNAGNVAILHSGAKYEQFSVTPVDSDFIKTMKWTGEQICQIVDIQPHLIGLLDRSTNNNIEAQGQEYITYNLRSRCKCWENEFDNKLFLTPEDRKIYSTRFNLEGLLRADSAGRAAFYTAMFNLGAYSSNDILKKEKENPREGGDKYYVAANMLDSNLPPPSPDKKPQDEKQNI